LVDIIIHDFFQYCKFFLKEKTKKIQKFEKIGQYFVIFFANLHFLQKRNAEIDFEFAKNV